jgi:hypothetical protein
MNNEVLPDEVVVKPKESTNGALLGCVVLSISLFIFAGVQLYIARHLSSAPALGTAGAPDELQTKVLPPGGVALPVRWGDIGKRMISAGVVSETKLDVLYALRGGVPADMWALLDATDTGELVINQQNAGALLNLLWAFGLANKNSILEKGPMQDPQYGGAGRFASTGGWTLAAGDAMEHYGMHSFITLTPDEQTLVERVARNIYRPCCGNSTYFPDCNHGMAMLGLLELMASQGATEDQMYKAALAVNSYWFPENYLTIARYMQDKGVDWRAANAKDVLGAEYSSGQGYQKIAARVEPVQSKSSGGCGV